MNISPFLQLTSWKIFAVILFSIFCLLISVLTSITSPQTAHFGDDGSECTSQLSSFVLPHEWSVSFCLFRQMSPSACQVLGFLGRAGTLKCSDKNGYLIEFPFFFMRSGQMNCSVFVVFLLLKCSMGYPSIAETIFAFAVICDVTC